MKDPLSNGTPPYESTKGLLSAGSKRLYQGHLEILAGLAGVTRHWAKGKLPQTRHEGWANVLFDVFRQLFKQPPLGTRRPGSCLNKSGKTTLGQRVVSGMSRFLFSPG